MITARYIRPSQVDTGDVTCTFAGMQCLHRNKAISGLTLRREILRQEIQCNVEGMVIIGGALDLPDAQSPAYASGLPQATLVTETMSAAAFGQTLDVELLLVSWTAG